MTDVREEMAMFNNAALNTKEGIWDLTMLINLTSVWWGCKHKPKKGLNKGSSIINTASFIALMGAVTPQLAYTASKGGILAMPREVTMAHAKEGFRIQNEKRLVMLGLGWAQKAQAWVGL
ncbi:hypothetical protein JB92DRAFT_2828675 [Gautieria morchelliformis]|nr:hypothetical protein JB92DRAFT_2828675 [Gautieria morchelliformis]